MTIERAVLRLAGVIILLGCALAFLLDPLWILLPAFVGLNMVQATFTGFCPAALILKKMGLKSGAMF